MIFILVPAEALRRGETIQKYMLRVLTPRLCGSAGSVNQKIHGITILLPLMSDLTSGSEAMPLPLIEQPEATRLSLVGSGQTLLLVMEESTDSETYNAAKRFVVMLTPNCFEENADQRNSPESE